MQERNYEFQTNFSETSPKKCNLAYGKCFLYTTKTRPNLATYTRKPGNNNGTIVFEIDIMKKSYPVNLNFTSLPLSKPKWHFFSGAVS